MPTDIPTQALCIIFQKEGVLQFRCKGTGCDSRLTWSRYRTGGYSDCLIDRRDCQGAMMAARCPHCGQQYAKRMMRSQLVANDRLEVIHAATD